MKRLKVLTSLILLIGLSISANCQSRSDSTLVHVKDARKAAIWAERGLACVEQTTLLEKRIELLSQRVELKDSIITNHTEKGRALENAIANYKDAIVSYQAQIKIREDMNAQLKKDIRRQKRKGVLVAILSGAAIAYLLVK